MTAHTTKSPVSRRRFITSSTGATLTAASWNRVKGANDRIGVGLIGFGLIGQVLTRSFMKQPDVRMVGIAEAYRPRLEAGAKLMGGGVAQYGDFRQLLDNPDIDAVIVATPDHWHALMTMMACAAGKDVYVDKPLTLFVREGRWMVQVAQRYKRVVQVGTQQRSGPHYQEARRLIQDGYIGDIVSVEINNFRNAMPGFGNPPDQAPPPEIDYDAWLGPAPKRPYNPNRALYHFRWFWDYSGGQMTNLGQHSLDILHWYMGIKAPVAVSSTGGRRYLKDNGQVPDIQDTVIEYPGFTAVCQMRECTRGPGGLGWGGLVFFGTKGALVIGRGGYEVIPDKKVHPTNIVARNVGGHPVGGPQHIPGLPDNEYWTENCENATGDSGQQYDLHTKNFLDCMKSRRLPIADLESGHRVVTACHLANISMQLNRKLRWDTDAETIVDDPDAARKLVRPYRAPWDAELRSLGVKG
jgi:predicted dehydrogenase